MATKKILHDTAHVRNIALVGHSGSGKTTLLETLLARAGAIGSAGRIDKGSTVSDFLKQEKQHQHSLDIAVCHFDYGDIFVNILDTPGYPDFSGRSMSVLAGVETAAVVVNAEAGVEMVAQRLMDFADSQKLCRMIIINRIDADGADPEAVLAQVRDTFGNECLPLNLPANGASTVADCFFNLSDETPDFSSVDAAHTEMIDQVVELDDELMEIYLEQGQDITPEQLHDPFEQALRRGHLVPVCFVSAETGAGLNQLLNIFAKLMPSPLEANLPEFLKTEGDDTKVFKITGSPQDHFIGHLFKINVDPYIGRMGVFRVHQGTVKAGDQVFIGERRKSFKVSHLYRLQGKETIEIVRAVPGDICAVSKIEDLHFDAVLHSSHDEDQFHLKSVGLPSPMYGVALELARRGDEKKLSDALHKLIAEDPSLLLEFNAQANETVLRGLGELHLRLVLERMKDDFDIEVLTHPPKISYRETVTRKAEGHYRHKKQTGGAGQFGEVYLRIEPLNRDAGFEFVNKVVGGSIPHQFIPAVEKGVRQVLNHGAIAGYPIQDLRVTVYDGKHHSVDSKEVAFVAAGKKAFADAIEKAKPIILEPIAYVEVTTPANHVGDITGHLSGVRGRINGNDTLSGNRIRIQANVPVAELGDYQTTLKSLTGGEGAFTMSFDHYGMVPPDVQKQLCAEFRPSEE
ncbi:MAG: elongation factor G [Gammaproteobacteria bacterium]|nr:elongation factor G [Gammaproteobacteria bacterium]MDP7659814.1 elongation factor G [Gammaproteobacteria bacterium]